MSISSSACRWKSVDCHFVLSWKTVHQREPALSDHPPFVLDRVILSPVGLGDEDAPSHSLLFGPKILQEIGSRFVEASKRSVVAEAPYVQKPHLGVHALLEKRLFG